MVKAQKRGKRSATDAALAPAPGEDAYLVQRTRETKIKEYNDDQFEDLYKDEIIDAMRDINSAASRDDGHFWVKDQAGNVLVFKTLEAANLRAAQEWESMQLEKHLGFAPAPEAEQQNDTRSPRKKVLADGRVVYSRKHKCYVNDGEADGNLKGEINHLAISSIKVEVIKASIIP